MTNAASIRIESPPNTPNGRPVPDTITNHESSTVKLTATEKTGARKALIKAQYNKARSETHSTLTAYGPNGKPTNDKGPNDQGDERTAPGRAERNWSSRKPDDDFVYAYMSGPMEARRRLRLKRGSQNPRDSHTTFDYDAYREAKAILTAWEGRSNWTEKGAGRGRWQPLAAPSCPNVLITPKNSSRDRVEPPSVTVELTEAISKGTLRITDKMLNTIYEQYLADPIAELNNLKVAIFAHVRTGYYKALDGLIVGGMVGFEEITYDFSTHIVRKLEAGKYPNHDGKLGHWVARCWPRFVANIRRRSIVNKQTLLG